MNQKFLMNQKNFFRKMIKTKLRNLSQEDIELCSKAITNKIINSKILINSSNVAIYVSQNNEVNTTNLIKYLIKQNKTICVPRIEFDNQMTMRKINKVNFLFEKKFNIKQPLNSSVICNKNNIDLIFVPGLGFDESKNRLGYGMGFYDIFLKQFNGIKVMLSFEVQKIPQLSTDAWDIKMDYIYSELKVY